MKKKLPFAIALVCTTPIILTSCVNNFSPSLTRSDSDKEDIPPESIIIEGPETVYLGCGTYDYSIKVEPVGAEDDVEWSSSDDSILTISSIGRAQPQKEGQVTITAVSKYVPDISDTIVVTVSDATVPTAITIAGPDIVYLHKEPSYHYSILTEPEIAKTDAIWSVSDTEIATIKQNGNLSPKKVGTVTIYAASAYDPAVTNSFEVEIKPEVPKKLTIVGNDGLKFGDSCNYTVEADSPDVCTDVTWSSNNPDLLSINELGQATAGTTEGNVTITATSIADPTIFATKNVFVSDNIIYVTFSETIGTGYDHFCPSYVIPGQPLEVTFRSRVYQDDETWLVIHKELKPTDLEVIAGDADWMKNCVLEHNVLTIPKTVTSQITTIKINILGAEISDWVSWDNIAKICKKDYDDLGKPGKHYAAQYFQVGDYKKGYKNKKLCGEYVIVDEYHDIYQTQDHSEVVDVPLALTFMPKMFHVSPEVVNVLPKSRWDDGFTTVSEFILFHNWKTRTYKYEIENEETHEITIKDYLRKDLKEFELDGLSSTSVRAPKKTVASGKHDIPYIDADLFWTPSYDEVYDPRVPGCAFSSWFHKAMGYEDGDTEFEFIDTKEGTLYAYFDQDKYHFYNDGHIRVPDPTNRTYSDGYLDVQLMLRSTWYTHNFELEDGYPSDSYSCPKRGFCLFTWLDPNSDTLREKEVRYPNTFDAEPANATYTYSASFCI